MKLDTNSFKKIKKYFSQKPNVVAAYLYGSQARGDAKKHSDIDLGIVFNKKESKPFHLPQAVFAEELGKILNRKVEIQDLNICRIDFAHRVLSEGRLIHSGNERKRINFEEKILRTYFDLKPSFDQYYYYLSQIAKKGELNVRYL